MSDVLILIPAAGAASRMRGRDKLLEEIDGEPVLARQAARALATGAGVLVTLTPDRPGRRAALEDLRSLGLRLDDVDGREGMAVSLRHAARAARESGVAGLMVLPADMPELASSDLEAVLCAFRTAPDLVHRGAGQDGTPGHPVVLPRRLFQHLEDLSGDTGGRVLLKGEDIRLVALPASHALTDLDTPEDWAAWRAARFGGPDRG